MSENSKRLLFIDANKEWLDFVDATLSNIKGYDATVVKELNLSDAEDTNYHYDLVFIGLNYAKDNIDSLKQLAQTSKWHFIVLFPGFPDGKTARIFFRAGMRDLLSKPYDPISLKDVIEKEIKFVEEYKKRSSKKGGVSDNYEINTHRLLEYIKSTRTAHP
jgi:DNA-binding NtrC family response regulator